MAPKEPFKVHSLSKHIENTKKGLSAEAQYNRRPANRAAAIKKEAKSFEPNNLFSNNDDDEEEGSSDSGSDSSDGDDIQADFLRKLTASSSATKKPASAASRRRSKDDEIADSDDERNASKKNASATKKAAAVKPEPKSSSDSSSESESDEAKNKANAKTNGTAPAKASDTTSSSSDSDSESESEDEKPSAPAKASSDSSSEESSDSESEAEPDTKAKAKPAVNGNTAAPTTSTSSSEASDSESEDDDDQAAKPAKKTAAAKPDSSSSSEAEDSDDEMVDESMHIEDRQVQSRTAVPNFIAPDFILRKGDDGASGQDVAEICTQANLEGKQFWYFTVPSNVPISVVQNLEIPMNQSRSGDSVFSHDGEEYGVSFESIAPKGNIQILIPSSDGSQYRSSSKQVDQVMQVKKITQLGANNVGPVARPTPRAQPSGLKARYQPIGVNEPMGTIGDDEAGEDIEMAEAPALSTKTPKKDKKRKSRETAAQDTPDASASSKAKKQKKRGESVVEPASSLTVEAATPEVNRKGKRKHTASEDDALAVTEQLKEESKSAIKSKKQKTTRTGSPDLGSEPASAVGKKQTPVLPPVFPSSQVAGTPAPKTTASPAVGTSKKSKKAKTETALPASARKETPIPTPRQSAVPIPSIPHSSPVRASSPSQVKEEKRARKRKESKKAAATPNGRKVTPVPAPKIGSE
ncbi:hypothetical protein N0V84_001330 [Fusarium piperis]|uniref:Uncharacterized protein n=1 Tax=Fusarium piperis TaxID=1435070 RepID=A0A9W8WLS8_9HYPO|nr:hypothetical protein N0V84_001330 [Fusarium piperis]